MLIVADEDVKVKHNSNKDCLSVLFMKGLLLLSWGAIVSVVSNVAVVAVVAVVFAFFFDEDTSIQRRGIDEAH